MSKASPGSFKGQLLKPSLPWQCPRTLGELPQGFRLKVTGSDSAQG